MEDEFYIEFAWSPQISLRDLLLWAFFRIEDEVNENLNELKVEKNPEISTTDVKVQIAFHHQEVPISKLLQKFNWLIK